MTNRKIAKVVIGLALKGSFHYEIPLSMRRNIKIGQRAWVPFRGRQIVGYIVGFLDKSKIPRLKKISRIIDSSPVLNPDILKLTKWMGEYYFCSWGEAIEAAIPETLRKGRIKVKARPRQPKKSYPDNLDLRLADEQKQTLQLVLKSINNKQFKVFLLSGITVSGKIDIYVQAIEGAVQQGKSAIILVPEVSLTCRFIEYLRSRFGETVAIFHSRLSAGEKLRQWQNIKEGRSRIVVGTRSAVLLPVKKLGIIIIDQEHEFSYKQDETPRYHSREVAIARAKMNQAVVILASATPSLESYHNAKKKFYRLIKLTSEEQDKALPYVRIVDMKREFKAKGKPRILSLVLQEAVRERLARKEGAMLFLNRRGFSTFVHCKDCGYVLRCKECRIPLTYHFHREELVCHYCGYRQKTNEICPRCNKSYLSYFGLGTQKVESEAARIFPQARIDRMDRDSLKQKDSFQKILDEIKKGRIDILVGTQIITRALDISRVTLVGVISADATLNLPDFRTGERTFQLLNQVITRAGGDKKKEVIIQTYNPEHYSIISASQHNYEKFYNQELVSRRELRLPPYVQLVNLVFRGSQEEKVSRSAERLAGMLKNSRAGDVEIIGPASLPLGKLRGNFRRQIILKGKQIGSIHRFLRPRLKRFKPSSGVIFKIDVDPVTVL